MQKHQNRFLGHPVTTKDLKVKENDFLIDD